MDVSYMIGWIRVFLLVVCLFIAARSDYSILKVRDQHWINWLFPSSILLLIELAILRTHATNLYMIAALIALASVSFTKPPSILRAAKWKLPDFTLFLIYIIGLVGLFGGALQNADTNFVNLILGDESSETTLWWSMLGAFITILVFLSAWRYGIIQGGADAKALIIITIFAPSWQFLPDPITSSEESLFLLPPSIVIFLWASIVFIFAPPILLFQNAINGNIEHWTDLKMAWHSTRKPISEIPTSAVDGKQVWILTEVANREDDQIRIVNRMLPRKNSLSQETILEKLSQLEEIGMEKVWIATKHPFVAYLFLAIFPLLLFGDPIGLIADRFD